MARPHKRHAPDLSMYLKTLKAQPLEKSIEILISLFKRRQIKHSRPSAVATAHLLQQVVAKTDWTDLDSLLGHVQRVGQRLVEAQPREIVIRNIVRRVLGMIREEAWEVGYDGYSESGTNSQNDSPHGELNETPTKDGITTSVATPSSLRSDSAKISEDDLAHEYDVLSRISRPPLMTSHTSYVPNGFPLQQSMFNLLSTTSNQSSITANSLSKTALASAANAQRLSIATSDLKAEVMNGIEEIIDELLQVDDQIASYAHEHIHSNEIILTHASSLGVQKFLLKAAEKRKFTVIVAEAYPNDHNATHAAITGKNTQNSDAEDEMSASRFTKPLVAAGLTVILVADATNFAIMSRVNKVILATHAVIANGGLIAATGTRVIARAAKVHKTPLIVISGIYQLSPDYPFESESLIEYGDPGSIVDYSDGYLLDIVGVDNPVYDYVPPNLVNMYITNLGAHAPSYLYRVVADHYKPEDVNFHKPQLQS